MIRKLNFVFIGLSITSSWGNGHATTYRSLIKGLKKSGHRIDFLERDVPWYSNNRDMPDPKFCKVYLYQSLEELKIKYYDLVKNADVVMLGSYVPDGVQVGQWIIDTAQGVTAFYDIDTPVTMSKIGNKDYEYLHPELIPHFNFYFSFTGGKILDLIESKYNSPAAFPLFCTADPDLYYPEIQKKKWDLGYLGTYSADRQLPLTQFLIEPANQYPERNFVVAGPQYPTGINWSDNIYRIEHLPPKYHRNFYNSQRFTLNITRTDMISAGWAPSVRLFEAAACGTPVISDYWDGITNFFDEGKEILIAHSTEDVNNFLKNISAEEAAQIGLKAREKFLKFHSAQKRAKELETYILNAFKENPA